jgi:hypothetical protein
MAFAEPRRERARKSVGPRIELLASEGGKKGARADWCNSDIILYLRGHT